MIDFVGRLLETGSLSPHGICLLWRPELIWTHVVADFLIGLSYLSIPVALGVLVTQRRDVAFGWMFWCFALFILACGTTHLLAIWTLFVPDYGIEALVKVVTAAASVVTAIMLWPLLPRLLALPSPSELRTVNAALTRRIAEHDAALAALREAVAERERAEAMLRQAQRMEAIGQLTGSLAHDFNNLLGIIVGSLERLQRLVPERGIGETTLQGAMRASERAAAMVRDLLAFARQQPLIPERLDINALLRGMTDLVAGAMLPEVRLATELEDGLWPACIDRNQLQSAVLNLVVNARDALDAGGTLTLATRNVPRADARGIPSLAEHDYVRISVRDTGRGMPPEVLERAVEPFFTTKPQGRGTGLGLSQVFGFVRQSGGHLALHSRPGEGTTVEIYLPRAPGVDGARDASSGNASEPVASLPADAGLA
ncbi:integral membrane sensor signal transduction histidine kinase [Methylobacterium sp. 4-46]|uniref:sensor histidine kinase n=1 Tax=unclassified Methylobacterium TaxID=2615210 RepID=UPI000165C6F6|nr:MULTISPECIES: ATP-binding protein [Methylobacterium]ACA17120.1 integral membrane sensor signal transduction histidine kinase [Methylobacterium sp. 4-46]WFT82805.1 ATP-binding protein [Methylobacterium nodulans]